jgi:hypothetical protein
MAKNIGKYREVSQLPNNAMTVQSYADSRGWKAHNIYMKLKRHTNDFEIILFQGINFVIPFNNQ